MGFHPVSNKLDIVFGDIIWNIEHVEVFVQFIGNEHFPADCIPENIVHDETAGIGTRYRNLYET